MKLSSLHQTILATILHDSRWSHKRLGEGFVLKSASARSLKVLGNLGLVEGRVFAGPRGGRRVGIRLTEGGRAVAERIVDLVEGSAPQDEQGNQIRDVEAANRTYTLEG